MALADRSDELGRFDRAEGPPESPQDVAIELRFGRYVPDVDKGLQGTPYKTTFGSGDRYYGGLEVDWQVLRIPYLGTLGPGFGIGYTNATAKSYLEDSLKTASPTRSAQDTGLEILPMYVSAVLRADVVARKTVIPFVPYAKLGMGLAFWRSWDADHTARETDVNGNDRKAARGHSLGPEFALGAMFLLDFLSPQDARSADTSIGLNHSYIFGEWFVSHLDNFGAKDTLNVGVNTWTVGLAMEF
jgi:hypothetical protein